MLIALTVKAWSNMRMSGRGGSKGIAGSWCVQGRHAAAQDHTPFRAIRGDASFSSLRLTVRAFRSFDEEAHRLVVLGMSCFADVSGKPCDVWFTIPLGEYPQLRSTWEAFLAASDTRDAEWIATFNAQELQVRQRKIEDHVSAMKAVSEATASGDKEQVARARASMIPGQFSVNKRDSTLTLRKRKAQ